MTKKYFCFDLILSAAALALLLLSSNSNLMASPASPAMLDANGCHTCEKVCGKYGLSRGQFHCHIFSPEVRESYQKRGAGTATNDEAQFGLNAMDALDYVSLAGDNKNLVIAPTKKKVEGTYRIVSQSCGFGAGPATIKTGMPANVSDLFGASIAQTTEGVFTFSVGKLEYPAIFTEGNRVIIIEDKANIMCSGQAIREKLYLYCKGSFAHDKKIGTKGFCRSSMESESSAK